MNNTHRYPLKGIIFDLDGTLLYTLGDIADAMNAALAEVNVPPITEEAYRWIVGGGAESIAARVLPADRQSEAQINDFVERFRVFYRQNWHTKTHPYTGIKELIDMLLARGMKIGILSNKPQEFTDKIVEHYFNQTIQVFSPVYGQRESYPVKPDPGTALEIAQIWNLPPSAIGFMGDSDVDIQTAQNAGMISIGAEWGFRGHEELRDMGSQILLKHPLDLIACLPIIASL